MRILIVGLNFQPEITGIGKYTGEMAAYLSKAGHQVRVITTPPYYPYWKVQPGYRWWKYRRESWSGMEVYRCPLWVPRNSSGIKRILHLLSFTFSSLPLLLAQIPWVPQIVLCIAPSFLSAPLALLTARLCKASAWLHIQDFELDAATQLGMLGSMHSLAGLAIRTERWLLQAFDQISTISQYMLRRLEQKGVRPERACLFPNWVDTTEIFPLPHPPRSLRRNFDIPENKTIVLYSGNMGNKQGLEILIEAARGLLLNENIHFVLCGEGSARAGLEHGGGGAAKYPVPAPAASGKTERAAERRRYSHPASKSRRIRPGHAIQAIGHAGKWKSGHRDCQPGHRNRVSGKPDRCPHTGG